MCGLAHLPRPVAHLHAYPYELPRTAGDLTPHTLLHHCPTCAGFPISAALRAACIRPGVAEPRQPDPCPLISARAMRLLHGLRRLARLAGKPLPPRPVTPATPFPVARWAKPACRCYPGLEEGMRDTPRQEHGYLAQRAGQRLPRHQHGNCVCELRLSGDDMPQTFTARRPRNVPW